MIKKKNDNYQKASSGNIKSGLWVLGIALFIAFASISQTENYSQGERIGFITKFSHKGRFWKSWEGELNLTQTGMNTSSLFEFSIDNDQESEYVISMIDSAVNYGWKVKLNYHQTYFKNWFSNRGETDYFISSIEVLDKNFTNSLTQENQRQGKVIDTVFVVIDKDEFFKRK